MKVAGFESHREKRICMLEAWNPGRLVVLAGVGRGRTRAGGNLTCPKALSESTSNLVLIRLNGLFVPSPVKFSPSIHKVLCTCFGSV
jgi:hypothetical protein